METIPRMLTHYGIPYRVVDRRGRPQTEEGFAGCAAVVMAQAGLGAAMEEEELQALLAAVRRGTGLVNLDGDLRQYPEFYREFFGFSRINPHPGYFRTFRTLGCDHFVTRLQREGEIHRSERAVTGTIVEKCDSTAYPLMEAFLDKEALITIRHLSPGSAYMPGNYPVLFAAKKDAGRAVQFAINPRVWRKGFLGPVGGIDDLLFQSIVYAARKPFSLFPIPNFILLSVDDCSGAHQFAYAAAAREQGVQPLISLLIDEVGPGLYPVIRDLAKSGDIFFNTHAFTYYNLFTYRFGLGEYTEREMEACFQKERRWLGELAAPQAQTVRLHWGEYGLRALPYYKKDGRVFLCPALQPGLLKADMDLRDGYAPYNLQTCYYDTLPDDPDFFCYASMPARGAEDFLTGATVYAGESRENDIHKAIQQGSDHLTKLYRAGFFGELVTHEQKIGVLDLDEWGKILGGIRNTLAAFSPIPVSHDYLGKYLRSRRGITPIKAERGEDKVRLFFQGESEEPVRITVVTECGAQEGEISPFQDETEVSLGS